MAATKDIRNKHSYFDRVTIKRTDNPIRFKDPKSGKTITRKAWVCGWDFYVSLRGSYYKLSEKDDPWGEERECIGEYYEYEML